MPKVCYNSQCTCYNQSFPDVLTECPVCHTPFNAPRAGGFSLNLGDANAISGGVNMSDDHSVSNNSVSNIDSHNVITNNITQIEREKSTEELRHERQLKFRDACIEIYSAGIVTSDGKRKLEDLQFRLGIDDSSAARIISEVSKRSERKSTTLSPVHQITFNNIKTAIMANRLDIVNRLLAQMKAMVQRYSAEEIQYTYYMLQAVLHPEECVAEFENHHEDKYWQSFWSSVAYRQVGNIEQSELLVADVGDKWIDTIPQDNVWILAAMNALLDNDIVSAKSLYDNITGEHSPLLSNLATCLYTLLYSDMIETKDLVQMQKAGLFYAKNLFSCFDGQSIVEAPKMESQSPIEKVAHEIKKPTQIADKSSKNIQNSPVESKDTNTIDVLSNPSLIFELKSKSATEQMSVYRSLMDLASKGNGTAGAYLAYFYIHGIIVATDLKEAEKRIMSGNYQKDPVLLQMLVDLYTIKNIPALAEVWKKKLDNINK